MFDLVRGLFVIEELRKRFLFTLAMIVVFRLGTHIPIAGVDLSRLTDLFRNSGVLGFIDLFSGGALSRFSILGLGVLPYINASIIMQLLMVVWPKLKEIAEEGESGRKQLSQYTRYLAILIAFIQGSAMTIGFRDIIAPEVSFNLFFIYSVVGLVAGAAFTMWLGELMTERGIGNGASLLIFVGIIARLPHYVSSTVKVVYGGTPIINVVIFLIVLIMMIVCIVFIQEAERKIPVQYAKRIVGRKVYGGQNTFIPMRLIQGGVLPIIFASAILQFPMMLTGIINIEVVQSFMNRFFDYNGFAYNALFCFLIFFFTYFYTAITFNPVELAENIKKHGGFIIGVRPGQPTVEYLEKIISRLTIVGATTLALIALVPVITANATNVSAFIGLGGTALLIMVGVAMDLKKQVETHLVARRYEGLLQ